jgi:DNA-binding NarL/FixJ family response regulator
MRVLIVEDHKLVSEGLETVLSMADDIFLVDVVDDGESAINCLRTNQVDVVLMDLNLGAQPIYGIEATRRIKQFSPPTRILVLSFSSDEATVFDAIKAGADGYLSKGASNDDVVQALHEVSEGRSVLDPNIAEGIFTPIGGEDHQSLRDWTWWPFHLNDPRDQMLVLLLVAFAAIVITWLLWESLVG